MNGEGTARKINTVSEFNAGGMPGDSRYGGICEALKRITGHRYAGMYPRISEVLKTGIL